MFIATGMLYNEKDVAMKISTFLFPDQPAQIGLCISGIIFLLFKYRKQTSAHGRKACLPIACSESYRSNEVLHSLVCASEKAHGKPSLVFKGILVELHNWNSEE